MPLIKNPVRAYFNAREAFRLWNTRRKIRKARKEGREPDPELLAVAGGVESLMWKELLNSTLRHFVPWASALLAGYNIDIGEGSNPILVVGAACLVYAGMQVWSWVRKVRNKPRET